MLTVKHGSLQDLADAIRRTKIVKGPQARYILQNLKNLRDGPELYGEVDLRNQQQVELAAYRVCKRVPRQLRWRKKRTVEYDLVIVGAGSTAAYYLDTLGPAHDKHGTLVIGRDNPWIDERGSGIPYINHTSRQIQLPSANETRYGGNESFYDRRAFGQRMTNRLIALAGRVVDDHVTAIERDLYQGTPALRLTCQSQQNGPFYARRVVFVAGSGKPREPVYDNKFAANVIDMNTFIRDKTGHEQPAPVVIWGSNAAIDAVAAAKRHGWEIKAWMYGEGTAPAWLPGTRYLSKPYNLDKVPAYTYADRKKIKVTQGSFGRINIRDDNQLVACNIKYLVYGLGAGDLASEVIKDNVFDTKQGLVPILDKSGVFHNPNRKAPQDKAFLGWGTRDGILQVFGLAAENYAPKGGSRVGPFDRSAMALKKWLSGDVLTIGQLAYIRSAMRAVNNFIPGSIEHRVDFSHADANQLRVHIAAKYPDIPERLARRFIGMIADVRDKPALQERLPHGFTAKQVRFIESQLEGLQHFKYSFNFWKLPKQLAQMAPPKGKEVADALAKIPEDER
ncbi:MAG: hypothetical protein Tsb0020_51900 [Haliangiales bacterium]